MHDARQYEQQAQNDIDEKILAYPVLENHRYRRQKDRQNNKDHLVHSVSSCKKAVYGNAAGDEHRGDAPGCDITPNTRISIALL
jgi:hypothetical protein